MFRFEQITRAEANWIALPIQTGGIMQAIQPVSHTSVPATVPVAIRTRARTQMRRSGQRVGIGQPRFRTDILRRLIARPLYVGRVQMNGREFPGQHQAIVTNEVWEQADAAISKELNPPRRRF